MCLKAEALQRDIEAKVINCVGLIEFDQHQQINDYLNPKA